MKIRTEVLRLFSYGKFKHSYVLKNSLKGLLVILANSIFMIFYDIRISH